MYSPGAQPVTMFTPNRPGAMSSMVAAIRATSAGGSVRMAEEAYSLIFSVTAASPAISVKDSIAWSQNSVSPPNPRNFTIDRAKSKPWASAFCTICLFSSKVGMYWGALLEMSQPLFAIGMNTPMSTGPPGPVR